MKATWPFQALAEENRLRVTRLLLSVGIPMYAGQIAAALKIQPNALSRHLEVLATCGVVQTNRQGRFVHVSTVSDPAMSLIYQAILEMPDETNVFAEDQARSLSGV